MPVGLAMPGQNPAKLVPCLGLLQARGGISESMARSWRLLLLAGLAMTAGAATPAAAKPQPPRIQGFSLADVEVGGLSYGMHLLGCPAMPGCSCLRQRVPPCLEFL